MKNYPAAFFSLLFILLLLGAAISLPSSSTSAAGFPPRPTDIFTPTPEPLPPTTTPIPPASLRNRGALISLHVSSPPPDLQSVVQWQDGLGEWHDVEGWRGELNDSNFIVWWVAPQDLGATWYRWRVYTEDGRIDTISDTFSLPNHSNQVLHIHVTLPQP